jgi:tellurite resistance protein
VTVQCVRASSDGNSDSSEEKDDDEICRVKGPILQNSVSAENF